MAEFMTMLSTFMTGLLSEMGNVVEFISDQPLILFGVLIAVGSIVIGKVKGFIPGI